MCVCVIQERRMRAAASYTKKYGQLPSSNFGIEAPRMGGRYLCIDKYIDIHLYIGAEKARQVCTVGVGTVGYNDI